MCSDLWPPFLRRLNRAWIKLISASHVWNKGNCKYKLVVITVCSGIHDMGGRPVAISVGQCLFTDIWIISVYYHNMTIITKKTWKTSTSRSLSIMFITAIRLWCNNFFHRLVLVHTACILPWWGWGRGRSHLLILLVHLLPITAHEFLSIYRIIDIITLSILPHNTSANQWAFPCTNQWGSHLSQRELHNQELFRTGLAIFTSNFLDYRPI